MGWIALILAVGLFLLFLFNKPKETIGCVGVVVVVIAVIIGGLLLYNDSKNKEYEAEKKVAEELEKKKRQDEEKAAEEHKKLENQVEITVAYDAAKCGSKDPLVITTINHSEMTVTNVEIGIAAYRPGFSRQLASSNSFVTDKIMDPSSSHRACCPLPSLDPRGISLAASLEYSISHKAITFKEASR